MTVPLPFPAPDGLIGLQVLKVLEEWDRVVLAMYSDTGGGIYIGVLVEENARLDTWLLAKLSASDLVAIMDGALDYDKAFKKAVVTYTISTEVGSDNSAVRENHDVPDDWLPLPDLRYTPTHLPRDVGAGGTNGVWVKLALTPPGNNGHTFPAKALGGVLRTFQSLLEATASALAGHKGSRGAFPDAVTHSVALQAVAFPPSSFGIILASTEHDQPQGTLYPTEKTSLEASLDAIVTMLNSGADEEQLLDRINMFGARQVRYYQTLLAILHSNESGLQLDWHAGGQVRTGGRLNREDVAHLVEVVAHVVEKSDEILSVYGELVAFNKETHWFKLVTDDDEAVTYAGQANTRLMPDIVEVGRRYRADIREVIRINPVTLEQTTNHHLLDIQVRAE